MDAEITKKRKGRKAFVVIANLASRGVAISGINSPSAFEIATVAALLRNDNDRESSPGGLGSHGLLL